MAGKEKVSEESIGCWLQEGTAQGCILATAGAHRVQKVLATPTLLWSTPQGSGKQVHGTQTPTMEAVASVPRFPHPSQGARSHCHQHSCTWSLLCSAGGCRWQMWVHNVAGEQGFLSQPECKGERKQSTPREQRCFGRGLLVCGTCGQWQDLPCMSLSCALHSPAGPLLGCMLTFRD